MTNSTPNTGEFVREVVTEHTGGGILVDLVKLTDGTILGITDESVVRYHGERCWNQEGCPTGDDCVGALMIPTFVSAAGGEVDETVICPACEAPEDERAEHNRGDYCEERPPTVSRADGRVVDVSIPKE